MSHRCRALSALCSSFTFTGPTTIAASLRTAAAPAFVRSIAAHSYTTCTDRERPSHSVRRFVDAKNMTTSTAGHYEGHTASSYEDAFFYSEGDYMAHLRDLVLKRLDLVDGGGAEATAEGETRRRRRILDVGGGTGNFTSLLLDGSSSSSDVDAVVVDPFLPETTDDDAHKENIQFVKAPAEEFIVDDSGGDGSKAWKKDYHHVLLKEVVHHFDAEDRVDIFAGMRRGAISADPSPSSSPSTSSPPSLLILTRPHLEIDYPLFPAARDVWAKNQPSADVLAADLRQAGFSRVECKIEPYPCEIRLDAWLRMVKNRFWSTFSEFTDEELEAGCEFIRGEREVDGEGNIRFEDRILFISAWK